MKERKPTIKDVKEILRKQVSGWNDKRSDHSRIKLTEQLSYAEQRKLHSELRRRFDAYRFTVGNIRWKSGYFAAPQIVGAIRFWK
jgi:hypothetical protein